MKDVSRSDIIVIGSGIAGLYFALHAAEYASVTILTKKELMESNSNYAQGVIAAVLDPLDDFEAHIEDTLEAGAYVNNRKAVEVLVREAPQHIHKLIDLGVGFNRSKGKLDLTKEGGHSKRRIVHVHDATGKEVERALIYNVRNNPNITIFESHLVVDTTLNSKSESIGVIAIDRTKQRIEFHRSKNVVIATGGSGQIYEKTTNPRIATGDGMSMAIRSGAKLSGMEFVQFHPTTLSLPGKPHFLLTESLRGEGAVLRNHKKQRFMHRYDKRKELAPRDIVSRAVYEQLESGPVYLDITHKPSDFVRSRFPYVYDQLWWFKLKLDEDLIPVAPAAHYMCGGIKTDLFGRTSVANLYAIGEAASTGVHGANRLASNSILECLVFGYRASKAICRKLPKLRFTNNAVKLPKHLKKTPSSTYRYRKSIQHTMWRYVGVKRTVSGLKKADEKLSIINAKLGALASNGITATLQETINMCAVALETVHEAQLRTTSAGSHYIVDAT